MTLAIQAALAIGRRYWGHISAALAVLFLILGIRGCGREAGLRRELAACLAKPPSVQYQTVTVTAKATQSVKIVYRDGSPCPDVEAVNTAEGGATVAQGQTGGGSTIQQSRGRWILELGAEKNMDKLDGSTYGGYIWPSTLIDYGIIVGLDYGLAFNGPQKNEEPRYGARLVLLSK